MTLSRLVTFEHVFPQHSIYCIIIFQAVITRGLKELRDKAVFFFSIFNALFVLIVFMLTLNKDILHIDWPFGVKTNITITDDNQVCLQHSNDCILDVTSCSHINS